MKSAHKTAAQIMISVILGLFLGIGLHGVLLSSFDGIRLLQKGGSQPVAWPPSTDVHRTVSPALATAIVAAPYRGPGPFSASSCPWVYADAESYYVLDHFPAMIMPCSYYARLLGSKVSRVDGRVFNRQAARWESRGFVDMRATDAERLVSTKMTHDAVVKVLGYPLGTLGEYGGLRSGSNGKPCVAWRYVCQDGTIFVVLSQSVVVGLQTNDVATAL